MSKDERNHVRLGHAELLDLKRWNTPTIYNGWEQITRRDSARENFNLEVCRDFMPTSMAFWRSPSAMKAVCLKPPGSWIRTNVKL